MKEVVRIGKTFVCSCGASNSMDITSEFSINSISIEAACSSCGAVTQVTLESFFKKAKAQAQALPENPLSFMDEPSEEKTESEPSSPAVPFMDLFEEAGV